MQEPEEEAEWPSHVPRTKDHKFLVIPILDDAFAASYTSNKHNMSPAFARREKTVETGLGQILYSISKK